MEADKIINVLYVDDEINCLHAFHAGFRRYFNIFTAISAEDAIKILDNNTIHVLISDQRMPNVTGVELLQEAVKKYPLQSRILISAYSDKEALDQAIQRCHIFDYAPKPWNNDELKKKIDEAYLEHLSNIKNRQIQGEISEELLHIKKKIKRLISGNKE